jgi:hypothetical protein
MLRILDVLQPRHFTLLKIEVSVLNFEYSYFRCDSDEYFYQETITVSDVQKECL